MANKSNQKTNWLPGACVEQRIGSLNEFLAQLQIALGVKLSEERIAIYLQRLAGLNEFRIQYAFKKAVDHFKPEFGRTFPSVAELREWAYQWTPDIDSTRKILGRGSKPPDWVPLDQLSKELRERIAKAGGGFKDMPAAAPGIDEQRIRELQEQAERLLKRG